MPLWKVLTNPTEMNNVLCSPPHGHNIVFMELAYIPTDPQEEARLPEEDTVLVERLVDALEDGPDCVRVWTA